MKAFSGLNRRQKTAWLIAGAAVLLALCAGALMLARGGRVVLNNGYVGGAAEPETAVPLAPIGDSRAERTRSVVVYYAADGYTRLVPAVRQVTVSSEASVYEAVASEALATPPEEGLLALGASDIQLLSVEVSCGVATVDLSIDARRLDAQRLHMLRAALVNSLMELGGIRGVNVLIDGREECIVRLPAGTMTRFDNDLGEVWQQALAEESRAGDDKGEALERNVTLYFGSADGKYLLPEMRGVTIEGDDYLQAIVDQLFAGSTDTGACRRVLPSSCEYLRERPEIVTSDDGSKVAVISFAGAASEYFARNGISTALAMGSLTRSICGFVPEVEGLLCDIDGIVISELTDDEGRVSYTFDDGVMRSSDFDSLVGDMTTLYYPEAGGAGLVALETVMSRYDADNPRALLIRLMEQPDKQGAASAWPEGVTDADVLGVRVEQDQVLINLSGAFYRACEGMTAQEARLLTYSIVNTMCSLQGIKSVRLYFDGERVDCLAGAISLRGPLLFSPGLLRGGAQP